MLRCGLRLLAVLALTLGTFSSGTAAAAGKVDATGTNDGAAFKIEIPANWNHTLVLFSHGYVVPGSSNPARDAPDSDTATVHITDPQGNLDQARAFLAIAQGTPQGRARLALVAAIGNVPGWFSAATPEPAATDFSSRETNQFLWDNF